MLSTSPRPKPERAIQNPGGDREMAREGLLGVGCFLLNMGVFFRSNSINVLMEVLGNKTLLVQQVTSTYKHSLDYSDSVLFAVNRVLKDVVT